MKTNALGINVSIEHFLVESKKIGLTDAYSFVFAYAAYLLAVIFYLVIIFMIKKSLDNLANKILELEVDLEIPGKTYKNVPSMLRLQSDIQPDP